jgi:hypothetical protein
MAYPGSRRALVARAACATCAGVRPHFSSSGALGAVAKDVAQAHAAQRRGMALAQGFGHSVESVAPVHLPGCLPRKLLRVPPRMLAD